MQMTCESCPDKIRAALQEKNGMNLFLFTYLLVTIYKHISRE